MVFDLPSSPFVRKHGPGGYTDYGSFKPWLRDDFAFRCVYCLTRERWTPSGSAAFGADHVIAKSRAADLECEYENLVYACNRCNSAKGEVELLDPSDSPLSSHMQLKANGEWEGLTEQGRILVRFLQLNGDELPAFRRGILLLWSQVSSSTKPVARVLRKQFFGFPDDLPDLAALRPPSNSRPEALHTSCAARRDRNELPDYY